MSRMVRMAGVLATGTGIVLLCGCAAGAEDNGANESLVDYIGYAPLANGHDHVVALAEDNRQTDEEKNQRRAIEDFVVTCMSDEGFEYVARYPDDQGRSPLEIEASLSAEEFAKQYGYGRSTIEVTDEVDPNKTIRDGLSPEAQEAYDLAQWGDNGTGGCRREADKEVTGGADDERLRIEKEFQDLADDVSRLHQRLDDDPRMRDATAKWADCMADGGYPGLEQTVDPSNLVGERLASTLDENGNPTRHDPEKLQEVRTFEIAIATVDFACQQEHIEPVRAEVATRLENQFIAEHKAELERFRDRAAESGARLGGT